MLKKLWVLFRKEPFLASLQYRLHEHVFLSYSEPKGLCMCYMDKTICVPYNNAAVILELYIALHISLEVGSFLFNFLRSQDLKATLHQSVNINTGRLQVSSSLCFKYRHGEHSDFPCPLNVEQKEWWGSS